MLKINEIFDTVQGEAFYTGTPATFIRLQGCPVGCHWCDTKHTWSTGTEKLKIEIDEMLHKTKDSPKWSDVSEKKIVNKIKKYLKKNSLKDTVNLILETEKINKKKVYNLCLKIKNEKYN